MKRVWQQLIKTALAAAVVIPAQAQAPNPPSMLTIDGVPGQSGSESEGTDSENVFDTFDGTGPLDSTKWSVYNSADNARLSVSQRGGNYVAELHGDPDPQQTLWYNNSEGRLDYVTLTGDFEIIVRDIGIESGSSAGDYQFCGLIVWKSPGNYEFAVVGNRGGVGNTLEYKITNGGNSTQADTGPNTFPNSKSDLRVVRSGSTVSFYFRAAGSSAWTLANHNGLFANRIEFGSGQIRAGLLTYGFSYPDPFVCSAEQVEIPVGDPE